MIDMLGCAKKTNNIREGLKQKSIEFSIKGWVGGSGGGQILLKKIMPLKSILSHFRGGQTRY